MKNPFEEWMAEEILCLVFGIAVFCIVLFTEGEYFGKAMMIVVGVLLFGRLGHDRGWWER